MPGVLTLEPAPPHTEPDTLQQREVMLPPSRAAVHAAFLLLLEAALQPGRAQPAVAASQQAGALLALRSAFSNGAEVLWTWGTSPDPCTGWTGVVCNAAGAVTALQLDGLGLDGSLPASGWAELPALQSISIASNPGIKGPLPALELPEGLQTLNLSFCMLSELPENWTLPPGLMTLVRLFAAFAFHSPRRAALSPASKSSNGQGGSDGPRLPEPWCQQHSKHSTAEYKVAAPAGPPPAPC